MIWELKDGVPDVLRLKPAEEKGYTLRTPPWQRPYLVVPTAIVGGMRPTKAVPVEAWIDGDTICIRVRNLITNAENSNE